MIFESAVRSNDIAMTLFYHFDIVTTSKQRRLNVMCWLGEECIIPVNILYEASPRFHTLFL